MRMISAVLAALTAALLCPTLTAYAAQNTKKPTLDLQPQSSFASGSDERGKPGAVPLTSGDLRLPFKLTLPLYQKLQFVFRHKYIDETLGRVTKAGAYLSATISTSIRFRCTTTT